MFVRTPTDDSKWSLEEVKRSLSILQWQRERMNNLQVKGMSARSTLRSRVVDAIVGVVCALLLCVEKELLDDDDVLERYQVLVTLASQAYRAKVFVHTCVMCAYNCLVSFCLLWVFHLSSLSPFFFSLSFSLSLSLSLSLLLLLLLCLSSFFFSFYQSLKTLLQRVDQFLTSSGPPSRGYSDLLPSARFGFLTCCADNLSHDVRK